MQLVKQSESMEDESSSVTQQSEEAMSVNRSLAMMRECQFAWEQLRKLRRYDIQKFNQKATTPFHV